MTADLLLVERDNGVVTLTLNRPERHNGINGPLVEAMIAALEQIAATATDRCLVVAGAGGRFCSGMDLSEKVRPDELTFMRRVAHLCTLLHDLPIPTIARVEGGAIGFGCNLALCCDLVLASDDAVFGEVFATLGLSMDGGGSWSLPRRVGLARAKEIAFFGQRLSGQEAAEIGMANRAVPSEQLDALVHDWSERLAAGPRRALSVIKASLNRSYESSFAASLDAETVGQALGFRSPESREGVTAFMEKRAPDFRTLDRAPGNTTGDA